MTDTTFETVAACVAQLDRRFGKESDQATRLAEMRLLLIADQERAEAVVGRACRYWARRPTLDELGQLLRADRMGLVA